MRFVSLLILFVLVAGAYASDTRTASKFNPKLSPEYVKLLKDQAGERKLFFVEQARADSELKKRHATELADLLTKHREARQGFLKEKHSAQERTTFFKAQRDEMGGLQSRQKRELQELQAEAKKRSVDFHQGQRRAEGELRQRLVQKKPQ